MSDLLFSQNYFEIFSLEPGIDPDLNLLKDRNRELQQQVHPDRFASSSDEEKRLAMQKTSLINEAFNTLKDPVLRLQYLLSMKGVDMQGETDTSMDGAFLMEQMELREEISDIRSKADPLDALDKIASQLKLRMSDLMSEFDQLYQADALAECRDVVRKLQFINKAQKDVSDTAERLEDEFI